VKTYELLETKHPDLFRLVDREGNWEHYFHEPTKAYLRGVTTILNKGYARGEGLLKFLAQHTERERDEILRAAGERGDMVHRAIDLLLTTDAKLAKINRTDAIYSRDRKDERPLDNDEWDCLLSFARFWNDHKPVVIRSEAPIFDLELGYAGTADALLKTTQECGNPKCACKGLAGAVGLFDWKTSGAIYDSYWAQTASYVHAGNIREYLPKGQSIQYTAILRLGTAHKNGGYELKVHATESVKKDMDAFLAARMIAAVGYKLFDPETDIQEIPDSIEITLAPAVEPEKTAKQPKEKKPRKVKAKSKK